MKEGYIQPTPKMDPNSDWVCLNCNNLNYSFRKICNRCKSITRQQNHQNYMQMHYMQIYYQQPYLASHEKTATTDNSPTIKISSSQLTPLEKSKSDIQRLNFRKQSSEGSEYSENNDFKCLNWNHTENQNRFMCLLDKVWEGFYSPDQISEFKTSDQIEKTREQDELEYENEDILTTFDFTFI